MIHHCSLQRIRFAVFGPFARTIDAARKYTLSSTLERVDRNAELVRGDLATAGQGLEREPGKGLLTGGGALRAENLAT